MLFCKCTAILFFSYGLAMESEREINIKAYYCVVFLCILLVVYALLKYSKYYGLPENFPPGPPCVPFLGVLPFIKGDFKAALQEWREDYGDIVGIKLGNELAVVLSDYDIVVTAFNDERCTGRPRNLRKIMHAFFASQKSEEGATAQSLFRRHSPEEQPTFTSSGIVFAHGPDWVEQRRFSLRTLRDKGFGKSAMEFAVREEVKKFTDLIDKRLEQSKTNKTTSTDLNIELGIAVVNSLWSILTGEQINHGDRRVSDVILGTGKFIRRESMLGALMIYPWLRHLPMFSSQFSKSKSVGPLKMRQLQDDMVALKKKRRESQINVENLNQQTENADFIDEYLAKVDNCRNRRSSFFGDKGVVNLQRSLTDLFGAGSETTTTEILFCFLYMIKYPEVQAKVQDEIDEICVNRPICLADKPLMSFTEATINEVMRHTCLVYTVPHSTTVDLEINGYAVPKDTAIYANMWHIMRDPDYWEDADDFKPERFLDEYGKYKRDERNIPFMLGKRVCIGQNVARNSMFLFFTSILQKYELRAPNGPENVQIEPIVGFIHYCPSYSVEFVARDVSLNEE